MKRSGKKRILLLGVLLVFGIIFGQSDVDQIERTMEIKIPTIVETNEAASYENINKLLYEASFRLLKTNSVDVETNFGDWDVVDYYSQATKTYENDRVMSLKMDQYLYTYRSAHGAHLFLGFVFDLKTGQELMLNDLFQFNPDFISTVNRIMNEQIEEKVIPIFDFTAFQGLKDDSEFYLKEENLVVVFQEYAYTPYSYGPLIFHIPLSELKGFLNPHFL